MIEAVVRDTLRRLLEEAARQRENGREAQALKIKALADAIVAKALECDLLEHPNAA